MTQEIPTLKLEAGNQMAEEHPLDLHDLKRKSIRGGMVAMLAQLTVIAIQLTSTVTLARLLTPDDYGKLTMVGSITAFAGVFRDLGLSSAVIQRKHLSFAQQSNLFWLNVALGAGLTAVVAACSPLIAWFYGQPSLIPVGIALSFSYLIGSVGAQPMAWLVRGMYFERQAFATVTAALVALTTAVTLALLGYAFWALVWSTLASTVTTTLLVCILSPFRPGGFRFGSGIREMLGFGVNVTAYDVVNYFSRNLDNVLIGKACGSVELGHYSRAYALLFFPITAVRSPIFSVAFPALSKIQTDPPAYRSYFTGLVRVLALLTIPLMGFILLAADPIIALLLGQKWQPVAPLLSAMGIVGMIQPTLSAVGVVCLSLGQSRRFFIIGMLSAVITVLGFVIGVRWGAMGVAGSYTCTVILTAPFVLYYAVRGTPVSWLDFLKSVAPAILITVPSMVVARLVSGTLSRTTPTIELVILAAGYFFTCASVVAVVPKLREIAGRLVGTGRNALG